MASSAVGVPPVDPKQKALTDYRKKLLEHREVEARLKEMREQGKQLQKDYDKSEDDLKALQSVGQVRISAKSHHCNNICRTIRCTEGSPHPL